MKLLLCSMYDKKSGIYARPFAAITKADAMRAFADIALDKTHPIGKHPEDYDLYVVGDFDDNTGIVTYLQMEHLAGANDFVLEKDIHDGQMNVT